jgi:ABC-2 type transport system ATP-binding protein
MNIQIKNLSKYFTHGKKRTTVLNGINFELSRGEIFGISGPNGAGKTTLLKILSGLIKPSGGQANILGYDLFKQASDIKSFTGAAFDSERSFYQALNVEQNLKFYGRLFSVKEPALSGRISYFIEKFGLAKHKYDRLFHCSAGTKQKLAVIRALLTNPDVILLDEFTKSMDEPSSKETASFLKEIVTKNNKICIVVSHEIELLKKVSSKIGFLKDGIISI